MLRAAFIFAATFCLVTAASAQTVAYFPRVLATTQTDTGLALSNPTADSASVTLTFFNSEGNVVGAPAMLTVQSGGQIARRPSELFSGAGTAGLGPHDFEHFRGGGVLPQRRFRFDHRRRRIRAGFPIFDFPLDRAERYDLYGNHSDKHVRFTGLGAADSV